MPQFDLQGESLRRYQPDLSLPADFDEFWDATLKQHPPGEVEFTRIDNRLRLVETYDVAFSGFNGSEVRGWLHLPTGAEGPRPGVVEYVGYGGGRGLAHERLMWALAGYAHLIMDTRGQGSAWSVGDTADPDSSGGPAHPGFMTDGILDPQTYYYRRLFVDAVRAVDTILTHPLVDTERVAVTGGSQGGGLAIAAAALHPAVAYTLPEVPFLCDFPRAVTISPKHPYLELVRYMSNHRDRVEEVFQTLSYFDCAILGRRSSAEALFSVGLMDETCPPSTVYAAYNWYEGPKTIVEYPFNDHEGGQGHHDVTAIDWLAQRFGSAPPH